MSVNTEVNTESGKNSGGLYAKVNMSLRSANIMVSVLIVVLVTVSVLIIKNSGFTVEFDTDGGSSVESIRLKYSDTVPNIEAPVKEGYCFDGWYIDRDCTYEWNTDDTVSGSMTLYAKWEKVNKR